MPTAILTSLEQLEAYLHQRQCTLSAAERAIYAKATFPLRLPVHYANLIHWSDPDDPLKKIALPQPTESDVQSYELGDPIGDQAKEAVPGLIHRYPDRALLLLTTYCHIHCRFCFRREVVSKPRLADVSAIATYLQQHTEIQEIIFSGGDPFTFPAGFVAALQEKFASLEHIRTWRWHTRLPVVNPESLTDPWLDQLVMPQKQTIVVVHVDHPREITPEMAHVVRSLQQRGVLILSQTVLLRHVNADHATLTELFRQLIQIGVKPYYLHHLDQAPGTHAYRLSIQEGLNLFNSLRGHLSGVCLPEYVLDLPGGYGKVPVRDLVRLSDNTYQATTFQGEKVTYLDQRK